MSVPQVFTRDLDNKLDNTFFNDVVDGFSKSQKTLPCKYFYNKKGSQLFEQICETPEYYVTRTECKIYQDYGEEMAAIIGEKALLIEPGAGSVKKIALLLGHLDQLVGFIPMDISQEILRSSAEALTKLFPRIDVMPLVADFLDTQVLENFFIDLPKASLVKKRVIFFPGSTIGNFHPQEAADVLNNFSDNFSSGDGLLIGVDLVKDRHILESAYDDKAGITAEFNLNLINRIANELDSDINSEYFSHRAVFNSTDQRVEMHLVSKRQQTVMVANESFLFSKGETIHTENSYKYDLENFRSLVNDAGFIHRSSWVDQNKWFSVHYLEVA
ncbi:MAG: L-histidine N-alpha-methyltransferase [Cellvibrionaceae bacterium]|jgi:L-histidine N-alpha-methyltransferase